MTFDDIEFFEDLEDIEYDLDDAVEEIMHGVAVELEDAA